MYIYKSTNIINNKIYIGQSKHEPEDNLNYFGSGTIIKKAIKKYGKENFIKEILITNIDSFETLNFYEIFFIDAYDSINKGYNILSGGQIKITNEMVAKRINTINSTILENGLTIAQDNTRKAVLTQKNTILENGLTIEETKVLKRINTINSTILENGLTIAQDNTRKALINKRKNIKNGKNMCVVSSEKAGQTKKSTILENGLTIAQNAAKQGYITRKNTILENGLTIEENASIKSGNTLKKRYENKEITPNNVRKIEIRDELDILKFVVETPFRIFCEKYNLPHQPLCKSYLYDGMPIFQNLRANDISRLIKSDRYKYKGWYAKIINE